MRYRRPIRILVRVSIVLALLTVLLWVLLTPPLVRRWTPLLISSLEARIGASVQWDGLAFHWPLKIQWDRLTIQEGEQVYLDIRDLHLEMSLRALFRRNIRVYRLEVAHLHFNGWVPTDAETESPPASVPDLPSERPVRRETTPAASTAWLLDRVALDYLRIRDIQIGPPLFEGRVEAELQAAWRPVIGSRGRDIYLDLHLRRTDMEALAHLPPVRLFAQGELLESHVALDARLEEVPLRMFGFGAVPSTEGAMKGHFRMHGDPAQPEAELAMHFTRLKPVNPEVWDGPPAEFHVTATLQQGVLTSRLALSGLGAAAPASFESRLPLPLSILPPSLDWPPEGALSGHLQVDTDLGALASLLVLDVHRLRGRLSVGIDLSGTLARPEIEGHLQLADGAYEHDLLGILLRDLQVHLQGTQNRLEIIHFSGTDGGQGELGLSGFWQVNPLEGYPFETALRVRQFRLLKNDTVEARADGALNWQGRRDTSALSGQLTVLPVEIRIPERAPPSIIDLNPVRVDASQPEEPQVEAAGATPHRLDLDLVIALTDRFFVRGRGLDSEWGGTFKITGTATEPVVTGSLSALRGRFTFFGRRLQILRGRIALDGAHPPTPVMDLWTDTRVGNTRIVMHLSGPLDKPEIDLRSEPELPEDEILARLLFGREAARVTPWQALTIAQAVNQLRGGGSTFDLMGTTRRHLGVDQIELRDSDDEEGGMAVSVGKYLSDRVYMEVNRDIGGEQTRARVEVELTPSLRLETEVGTQAEAGLGLIWTWDY